MGTASEYNIFVFDDIEQKGTDVQGRVAAGENATYSNFSIGSQIPPSDTQPVLVVGGDIELFSGSIGSNPQQLGTAVVGGTATLIPFGPNNPSVGSGGIQDGVSPLPVDFAKEQDYLSTMSDFWGKMPANGTVGFDSGEMTLTGQDSLLNIFNIKSSDIIKNQKFSISAPLSSTVLVNITGENVNLVDFGFFFNEQPGRMEGDGYNPLYPYSRILLNFFDAKNILIDLIEINGSLLAPLAAIDFTKYSHIDGNLIAYSLYGEGEAHNIIFNGELPVRPVPEPSTLLLLSGGLIAIFSWRRKL